MEETRQYSVVKIHGEAVSWKAAGFLCTWTSLVSLFSWFGFNRLEYAQEMGEFQYLWHGVGEHNLPWLFTLLKGFLAVWSWVTLGMAVFGGAWFTIVFLKLIVKGAR